jgi:IS5 family transposase
LYRDLLFRKFCHLELTAEVPEASTLGRFRNKLVEHNLLDKLLKEINRQLEEKNIIITQGRINIIDAIPIEAAQSGPGKGKNGEPKKDPEAGWHFKLGRTRFMSLAKKVAFLVWQRWLRILKKVLHS